MKEKKIVRLFGIGHDADGHIRLTGTDDFDVFMGGESTHDYLCSLCRQVTDRAAEQGKKIQDLTLPELHRLIHEVKSLL